MSRRASLVAMLMLTLILLGAAPTMTEAVDYLCYAALPQIHDINPSPATAGGEVIITGLLFQGPPCLYDVTFGGVSSPFYIFINDGTIGAIVPDLEPGVYDVVVHVRVGGSSNPYALQIEAPPTTGA